MGCGLELGGPRKGRGGVRGAPLLTSLTEVLETPTNTPGLMRPSLPGHT